MNSIEVTVCCLAYNHEKYIRETLEGFVKQKTTFRYEVIVHDDASNDATSNIINEYRNKYPDIIKPIFQKENQYSKGISIVKQFILPVALGEYIATCEGDDYWNDEYKLQKQYDIMQQEKKCSLVVHQVKCCNEDGTLNSMVIPESKYGIDKSGIISQGQFIKLLWEKGGYPFHTSSYFYKKSVREQIDISKWTEKGRDIDILKACFLCGDIYYIDEAMSTRRLESVGNWNSRLKASGLQGQIKLARHDNETEIKFNEYTNGRYKDQIRAYVFTRIVGTVCYEPHIAKSDLKKYKLTFGEVKYNIAKNQRLKVLVKYLLVWYFPFVFKIIKFIKKM